MLGMKHSMPLFLLTPTEARSLLELVGRPIDVVSTDHWSVRLLSGDLAVEFYPEEYGAATHEHPRACITRIAVSVGPRVHTVDNHLVVAQAIGSITKVSIVHTLVSWSPRRPVPPRKLLGAQLPAGYAYGPMYTRPSTLESFPDEHFPADLGVGLDTDTDHWCLIFTNGSTFGAQVAVDDIKPKWPQAYPEYFEWAVDLLSPEDRLEPE
jgi:hypothetical protein